MPVNFTAPEGAKTTKTEDSMFAPTPLWERDRRRRSRGARRSDPAIDAGEPGAGAGVMGATTPAEPADAGYETQPTYLDMGPGHKGVAAGVIAAGAVVVAALGGFGWYTSQKHDHGLAQLTPGAPATREVALNTLPPPADATPAAPTDQNGTTTTTPSPHSVVPAPPHHAGDRAAAHPATPRVRPADNSSALSSGVDAGATAPMIATPAPSPRTEPKTRSLQPSPSNPVVNPLNPAAPPNTTPPAGSIDDSAAPTASRSPDPSATP